MQRFRHASRDLWNHYFFPAGAGVSGDMRCSFDEVQEALFRGLVLHPASLPDAPYGFLNSRILVSVAGDFDAPAMINRDIDSGYWDYPVQRLESGSRIGLCVVLRLERGHFLDHQYVRVQILGHSTRELIGKSALLEVQYVLSQRRSFR